MHTYMYMYIWIYIYTYVYVYIYMYLYAYAYIRICIYVYNFICMYQYVQCRRKQKVMQLSFVAQTRLFLFVGRCTFRAKISSGFSGGSSVNVPSGLIHLTLFIVYTADHALTHQTHACTDADTNIHTDTQENGHPRTRAKKCIRMHAHANHTCRHTHTHTHTHSVTRTHIHECTSRDTHTKKTHTHTRMDTYTHNKYACKHVGEDIASRCGSSKWISLQSTMPSGT